MENLFALSSCLVCSYFSRFECILLYSCVQLSNTVCKAEMWHWGNKVCICANFLLNLNKVGQGDKDICMNAWSYMVAAFVDTVNRLQTEKKPMCSWRWQSLITQLYSYICMQAFLAMQKGVRYVIWNLLLILIVAWINYCEKMNEGINQEN